MYTFIFTCSLYDAGHTIVGVEIAEQAVREFFEENKIEYTVETVDKINGTVYKVTVRFQPHMNKLDITIIEFLLN